MLGEDNAAHGHGTHQSHAFGVIKGLELVLNAVHASSFRLGDVYPAEAKGLISPWQGGTEGLPERPFALMTRCEAAGMLGVMGGERDEE
ncbi:hypothetical protein J4573_49420 [Actinomadura barringtoniae]|uniref:Uncharacterized protein n=1 Tax=Actinomadura barringtoniae TaxID=1427535 RepID=A0A939TAA2_9ACTN|nr:hypothetical protein [Actinomadura barringtoniae]MBO2455184.1 hypothetical protein [Actinomadura barringtoniae]